MLSLRTVMKRQFPEEVLPFHGSLSKHLAPPLKKWHVRVRSHGKRAGALWSSLLRPKPLGFGTPRAQRPRCAILGVQKKIRRDPQMQGVRKDVVGGVQKGSKKCPSLDIGKCYLYRVSEVYHVHESSAPVVQVWFVRTVREHWSCRYLLFGVTHGLPRRAPVPHPKRR